MWTFTDDKDSGLANIFDGSSFNDGGELEVIDGHPEGAAIPSLPDAPQEFSSGLYTELKKLTQQIHQHQKTRRI